MNELGFIIGNHRLWNVKLDGDDIIKELLDLGRGDGGQRSNFDPLAEVVDDNDDVLDLT